MSLNLDYAPPPKIQSNLYSPADPSRSNHHKDFITLGIVISAVIFIALSLHFLIKFLLIKYRRRNHVADVYEHDIEPMTESSFVHRLPEFTFGLVEGPSKDRDCSICLAKFQPSDRLRLLPICCHAFHIDCVDGWLRSNLTCPLCRSCVHLSESEIKSRILSSCNPVRPSLESISVEIESLGTNARSNEYLVAMGSESVREDYQRSEVVRSFEYVTESESSLSLSRSEKDEGGRVTREAQNRSWLREYVERLSYSASSSTRALSLRSSGRFFAGSSRRNEIPASLEGGLEMDVDRNIGVNISEIFRWLSTV